MPKHTTPQIVRVLHECKGLTIDKIEVILDKWEWENLLITFTDKSQVLIEYNDKTLAFFTDNIKKELEILGFTGE